MEKRIPFNLIVTHYPGYDNYVVARNQIKQVIDNMRVIDSRQSLMLLYVEDPYKAIEVIREAIRGDTPILRVIPVDSVTDVYVERVANEVKELFVKKVPSNGTFKIELDGRLYMTKEGEIVPLHSKEAIEYIASFLDNPVNLKKPDYVVYIKTLRLYRATELASITICRPSEILRYTGEGK